jgi:hypothetical protein
METNRVKSRRLSARAVQWQAKALTPTSLNFNGAELLF